MPVPIPPRCTVTSKFRSPCSGLHVGVARPDSEAVGVYPKLTVKGRPANFGPEWFKTFEEARVHILDLAAYIFEEELRIAAA